MPLATWFDIETADALAFMVRLALGVSALLLTALCASAALMRASAAVRHRLWSLSVLGALVLPAISPLLPEWRIGLLEGPAALRPSEPFVDTEVVAVAGNLAAHGRGDRAGGMADFRESGPESLFHVEETWSQSAGNLQVRTDNPWRAASAVASEPVQRPASADSNPPSPAIPASLVRAALALWLAGVLLGLVRAVWSMASARALVRRAGAISDRQCLEMADDLCRRFSLARRPALVESGDTVSPLCIGWWRPVVVMPAAWRDWSAEEQRAALAHELAHVRRRDVAWQLLAQVSCALYWFQPLVWLAAWRMRVERELACDDCVLNLGEQPAGYARTLLKLAAQLVTRRQYRGAGTVAMARGGPVEQRIRSILRPGRRRSGMTRATGWALGISATCTLLIAGIISPLSPVAHSEEPETTAAEANSQEPHPSTQAETQPPASNESTAAAAPPAASAPAIADLEPRAADAADTSRIWHILRGGGSTMTLLHGLPTRLHAALAPAIRETEVWQGVKSGTSLRLKISAEGESDGEIVVGFFTDPRWYAVAPVQVRRFPGPGEYTVRDLPPGRFHLGAMAGDLPRPAATGVGSTWPEPVELHTGRVADAHVLVSSEFTWRAIGGGNYRGETGDWGDLNRATLAKVQVRDTAGRLLPWCRVTFVERDEDKTHEFHDMFTDHLGQAYCDKIAKTFSLNVQCFEILPELMGTRYIAWRMDALNDARFQPEIDVSMEDFPMGTGRIVGRAHNQHGEPLREYHLSLTRRLGERLSTDEMREYCLRIPVIDSDGRFEVNQLAPGDYTATAFALDMATHVLVWEATEFTIPDEPNATVEVGVPLEAKELRYGRAVYEDGKPVYPGGWTAWFHRDPTSEWGGSSRSMSIERDGSFRVPLSAEEREQLVEESAGLIEVYESGGQERRVTVAFEELQLDPQRPRRVVIPRTAPVGADSVPRKGERSSPGDSEQP